MTNLHIVYKVHTFRFVDLERPVTDVKELTYKVEEIALPQVGRWVPFKDNIGDKGHIWGGGGGMI